MGKALTGEAAITPCASVLEGPLVLWCPGTAMPTLIAGAKAVVESRVAPTAPQWVFQPSGAVVAGSDAAVKQEPPAESSTAVVPVMVGPNVKMEVTQGMVPVKAEDFAAAAIAAAAAVLPVDVGGQAPP